jgi:hypothetical protein
VIWGLLLGFGGTLVAAATLVLRDRLPRLIRVTLLVAGAVAVGLGAIGLQEDASAVEWLLTPAALAALAVLHDRLVFAGEGPRRI